MKTIFHFSLVASIFMMSLPGSSLAATQEQDFTQLAHSKMSPHDRLWKVFKINWDYLMKEYPEWATGVGYPGQDDRLTDMSLASIERRKKEAGLPLKALSLVERKKLSSADQDNYDLFKYNIEMELRGQFFPGEFLAISQLDGIQQDLAATLDMMPRDSVKNYEDRISRLKQAPQVIDQIIVLLQKGVKRGVTAPKITLRDVPDQIKSQEDPDSSKNPLLTNFRDFPQTIPAEDQKRLFSEASTVVMGQVVPAFHRLRDYVENQYIPKSRDTIAWEALPNGKAWYEYAVERETTTHFTPAELHELGLKEVARIHAEMEKIIQSVGFKGDFAKFSDFLRTDPQFFFNSADELLTAYRDIAKRIDPELPRLFGKLPRLTYGVKPVPEYSQKSQTTAYYEGGSPKAGRAGTFFANTYDLKTRPKWEMEALTLHEAVPGHHLQISLAQEMEDTPEFRKEGGYTAFVEGWGLYAESLGDEIGLYKSPYSKFGQLTYEVWRAVRLVVDTGIHSQGWTRDQAIDYFRKNTSKTDHDITVEVDRYIVECAQALAYKSGELRIKALRAEAQKELGDAFDIREFHDAVLGHGAVPLDVLDSNVRKWIASRRK